ncbi:MAG: Ig-like domain-containing protein [Clostridiales Family XIII bacterium]|jgi:hypothetical protein|nr:Ig-like domain-containing protein [Clostridiales Family XIII bacterium]
MMRFGNKNKKILTVIVAVIVAAVVLSYVLPFAFSALGAEVPADGGSPAQDQSQDPPQGETPEEPPAPEPPPAPSLRITNTPPPLNVGEEAPLSYELKNAEGAAVVWASGNPAVVAIDANGRVKALAPGTAEITAAAGEVRDSILVKVNDLAVEKATIAVSELSAERGQSEYTVKVGEIYHLSVQIEPEGAKVGRVTWTLGNPDAASLSKSEEFIATAVGSADVTVTVDGCTDTITFIIEENGIPIATIIRYIIAGVIIIAVIITVILLIMHAGTRRKEAAKKRAAAKKRREAETSMRRNDTIREARERPAQGRKTKIYGAGVGANGEGSKAPGGEEEPERPFSLDDIE